MTRIAILFLAFCAGFAIMCFELLGGRMLAPYFGSSVYVWGSIITIFMLALSVGYLSGGKCSLYRPNINKYGGIFMLAALGLLPTIFYAEDIMAFVFERVEDPRYGSLLTATLIFFAPTIVMGMIAPYSVRILTVSRDSSGQTAGFLYFVSTLGSAIGTIMTSFYFVVWMEIDTILWLTFTILAGAALLAWGVAWLDTEDDELDWSRQAGTRPSAQEQGL